MIKLGLVHVQETGGTNKTINGYAYFTVAAKGHEHLIKKRSASEIYEQAEQTKQMQIRINKLTIQNLELEAKLLNKNERQF